MPASAGIERRLAHQAVNAGLGPQPAVGVVAAHMHSGALDAGHFTVRGLDQFRLEPVVFAEFQVHAQQHLGEVLRIVAAGACRHFKKRVGPVHGAAEHAAEFELLHLGGQALYPLPDILKYGLILLFQRQFQQFAQFVDIRREAIQALGYRLE